MPLLRENKYDQYFNMHRLYSKCFVYTATGRIQMHSPNLQFVPRNFSVNETVPEVNYLDDDASQDEGQFTPEDIAQYSISLRNLFIPSKGNIFLSADYSQLELRVLAHLSDDANLLESLNSGEDVFKQI
ncbi:DNA polymerase theta, partial [Stegodyphus mimosarum]